MKRFLIALLVLVAVPARAADTIYVLTRVTTTTSASGVAGVPLVIVGANAKRKGMTIWNNGGNSAYYTLTTAGTCSGNTPNRIQATFTSWELWGPGVWTGPVCAVRNAGTGTFTVHEYW